MHISPVNSAALNYSKPPFNGVNISHAKFAVKNPIHILFSDIDGTILTNNYEIPQATTLAIKELEKANIPIVITTGRGYKTIDSWLNAFGIKPGITITESGGIIVDKDKNKLYQNSLSLEDSKRIVDVARSLNMQDTFRLSFDGDSYLEGSTEIYDKHSSIRTFSLKSFDEMFSKGQLPTRAIFAKFDSKSFSDIEPLRQYLDALFGKDLSVFVSGHKFCEITNKVVSKALGVEFLHKFLNIDFKNMASIGDAENDLSMSELLSRNGGMSIAMGNGVQKMKDICKYITDDVSKDGFKKAIDAIININENLSKN